MFKSALIYQFTDDHQPPAASDLELALSQHSCGEIMSQEAIRYGFTPVCGELFTFSITDLTMFAVLTKSKDIPASALAAEIRTRRENMERDLGRWLSSKEKFELKEAVITDLLPRAFTTEKTTRGYIDHSQRFIVIETSSAANAEDVLALLRKALETLPVRPWEPDCDPRYVLTDWLQKKQLPVGFGQGYAVTLDSREDGEAKLKDISLDSDEVAICMQNGRMVSKIALTFDGVEFNLSDWMQLTGIKPLDSYKAQLDGQDAEELLATELSLFAGWMRGLITALDAAMADEVAADV